MRVLRPLMVCIPPTINTMTCCDQGCHCRTSGGDQPPFSFAGWTPDRANPLLTRRPHDGGQPKSPSSVELRHPPPLTSMGGWRTDRPSSCFYQRSKHIPLQHGHITLGLINCLGSVEALNTYYDKKVNKGKQEDDKSLNNNRSKSSSSL